MTTLHTGSPLPPKLNIILITLEYFWFNINITLFSQVGVLMLHVVCYIMISLACWVSLPGHVTAGWAGLEVASRSSQSAHYTYLAMGGTVCQAAPGWHTLTAPHSPHSHRPGGTFRGPPLPALRAACHLPCIQFALKSHVPPAGLASHAAIFIRKKEAKASQGSIMTRHIGQTGWVPLPLFRF